jgi:amino acid adenylation domain-containing protein
MTGNFDVDALQKALDAIVGRHESLRTTLTVFDGEPFQLVHPAAAISPIPVLSVENCARDKRLDVASAIAAEEAQGRFDLSAGPLWRAKLVRLSSQEHLFILTLHHSITDGWSMSVLLDELGELYDAFRSGHSPNLPELTIQYSDFARWQQECTANGTLARKADYWERTLHGVPALLDLPTDRPRPPVQSHEGRQYRLTLDAELAERISSMSVACGVTTFMTLLAAFETLLWRYTGAEAFVVGTPVAGRSEVEWERLIGLFVNTLPLRADLTGDLSFRDLLGRVRDCTLEALAHQEVPFETIVDRLRQERSLAYTPLFQVMFLFQNMPRVSHTFSGMQSEEVSCDQGTAKYDLTLEVFECDGLHCTWEYRTELFNPERIARMAEHFEVLLREIVADPDRKLSELPMLTSAERKRVLIDWNATYGDYPRETCIHEAFEHRAKVCGNALAVLSDERNITFAQLNSEANAVAHHLQKLGVTPQARVGIFMERSVDAIVAMLAVMKTGASYVPIDGAYPAQRIVFMLADSGAAVLVTEHRLRKQVPDFAGTVVYLDNERPTILTESKSDPQILVRATDPAYVIYTSGSTGAPKGVIATHRACMNRFAWMWRAHGFERNEVCAHRTSLSFVDSVWEIFGPLLDGVPLSIIADDAVRDPQRLLRHLAAYEITRIVLVPSLIESLLECGHELNARLPHLRLCVSSGEALPYRLYERFQSALPRVRLINLYGSSEVAADVTCFDTAKTKPIDVMPIGKPIANVRVYILDKNLQPVPIGVPGEIYVAGDCLANGYLGRPELTADRFPTITLGDGITERVYKSGDLGRFREDGNVEFLGRVDRQVKIRGIRIEPDEIEALLTSHPLIHQALVVARDGSTPADRRLIAYLTAANGEAIVPSHIRRYLQGRLAEPMIPSAFITLPALPLTPNGKIDQLALPSPESVRFDSQGEYLAPRNATEEKLHEIWSEVLGVQRIGVYDNFFELGGHSLMAVRVLARLRRALGAELAVRSFFEGPTIAALAAAAETARANGEIARVPTFAAARSSKQDREELLALMRELSDDQVQALLQTMLDSRLEGSSAR